MPPKCERSGETLIEKPCNVTQRLTRIPIAPIFASVAPSPTQMPMRPRLAPCRDAELAERCDHPAFERMDETADVAAAPFEVEHQVADPLAGAMIGVAAAAACLVDREAQRIEQLGGVGAGAGSEQGRMLEQPDAFRSLAGADRGGALFHECERLPVVHEAVANAPFDVVVTLHTREMALQRPRSKRCKQGAAPA